MTKKLRILIVEDSDDDAELVMRELQRASYDPDYARVDSQAAMEQALQSGNFDIIISDYSLPHFDAPRALETAQRHAPAVPFIVVSGTVGEETAVLCMRAGARDYISKNNLVRLGAAVERELAETAYRLNQETAQRRLEAELRHAQKMEAVGRLAGGIAHDFNNLLTAIFSFTRYAMQSIESSAPAYSDLQEVLDAAKRAETLTGQLLAFSRKQVATPRGLCLNALVSNTERMVRRILSEAVGFETRLTDNLWSTKADPGHTEQVLVNLVVNAQDAMDSQGCVVVETANKTFTEDCLQNEGFSIPKGDYVCLTVSDNGKGIHPDTRRDIFEPFFTTKPEGKGSGLGLSTCYGIIKQAGGYISVQSELNVGTTFTVYLPRYFGEAQALEVGSAKPKNTSGNETILVVEDDHPVRKLIRRGLSLSGYRVLEASNGNEACSLAESIPDPIDLVITDVVMPGFGGMQLAEEVARLHPESRILYITGYSDNAMLREGVLLEEIRLLQKPFTPEVLLERVRQVLDEAPREATAASQSVVG